MVRGVQFGLFADYLWHKLSAFESNKTASKQISATIPGKNAIY